MRRISALPSRFSPRALLAPALMVAAIAMPAAAKAEDEPSFPKISGTAAFVSDYRFRGVSLSNRDPAVQASIQLTTKPGFFIGAWGSSIAEYGATEDSSGATTEIDLYGGWSGPLGPMTATVGVYSYLYPGGTNVDAFEFYGTLAGSFGPATLTVGLNWAPDQSNLSRSSRYVFGALGVAIPGTPLTFKTSIGHERGAFVVDGTGSTTNKFDYLLGVDLTWKMLTFGVGYSGNDLPDKSNVNTYAKNSFFVSLTAAF